MHAGNVLALAIFAALAAAAVVLVTYLGPFGLLLLGLLTLLICNQYTLDETAAGWGTAVFRQQMAQARSAEERAASLEARRVALAPVRFYQRCGGALVVAGLAGLAWRYWH